MFNNKYLFSLCFTCQSVRSHVRLLPNILCASVVTYGEIRLGGDGKTSGKKRQRIRGRCQNVSYAFLSAARRSVKSALLSHA